MSFSSHHTSERPAGSGLACLGGRVLRGGNGRDAAHSLFRVPRRACCERAQKLTCSISPEDVGPLFPWITRLLSASYRATIPIPLGGGIRPCDMAKESGYLYEPDDF